MSVLTHPRADMCYCPGCSHGMVLEQLGRAIDSLGLPPARVCVVSDIGCIGTADRYFACHTFHGLHGRAITYAEGIKRTRPETVVIVLIGDGGCGIGTAHLVHAARRGADIKVVVCNNFNFGMTGGQHSPTTPLEARTSTTPDGAADRPFDICGTVAINGAAHASRHGAFDPQLADALRTTLTTPGFALIDVWELCTAYFVPANKLNRGSLDQLSSRLQLPFGVLHHRPADPPRVTGNLATPRTPTSRPPRPDVPALRLHGVERCEICVAGSAGERIRSAAGVIGEIAVEGGLFAAQLDDFPITVRRGFSVSNLILSRESIRYTGLDHPNLVVLLSDDGVQRLGDLSGLAPSCRVVASDRVHLGATPAKVRPFQAAPIERRLGKESVALAALTFGLVSAGFIENHALRSAADAVLSGAFRQGNLDALALGAELTEEEQTAAAGAVL